MVNTEQLNTELETKWNRTKKGTKQMDFRLKWAHKVCSYFVNLNNLIWRLKSARMWHDAPTNYENWHDRRRARWHFSQLKMENRARVELFAIAHQRRPMIALRYILSLSRGWSLVRCIVESSKYSWRNLNVFCSSAFLFVQRQNVADRFDGRPRATTLGLCHGQAFSESSK